MQVFAQFWKISGRVSSSHGLCFHNETKQALIFSRIEQKPAQLHVYHPRLASSAGISICFPELYVYNYLDRSPIAINHINHICYRSSLICQVSGNFRKKQTQETPAEEANPWPKTVLMKTKIFRLEKLHSCVNPRTLEFPALWRLHSFKRFGRNFVLNVQWMSVASFSPFLIFFEVIQWYHADENFTFVRLTFKRETQLSRFREKSRE